jgi:hypothetical protein
VDLLLPSVQAVLGRLLVNAVAGQTRLPIEQIWFAKAYEGEAVTGSESLQVEVLA